MTSRSCDGESFEDDDDDDDDDPTDDVEVDDVVDVDREPGFQNLSGIGSAIPALLLLVLLTAA